MTKRFDSFAARAAPALFVLLWSTGFIGTKYALEGAEPLTMQALRMSLVVILLGVGAALMRPVWPDRAGVMHSIVASILVHGIYLGGTAVAIAHSVPAGLSALIPGLQPVLTSTLANRFLGERVTRLQWIGLLLGLSGVVLVLHNRNFEGQSLIGWAASGVSLVSITVGTLYQKRFCSHIDWRAGNLIQFIAVTVFFAIGAFLFETRVVNWTIDFRAGDRLAVRGAVGRHDRAAVLADPPFGGHASREPVLPGARRHRADGLGAVRRTPRCAGHHGYGGLRRRRYSREPAHSAAECGRCKRGGKMKSVSASLAIALLLASAPAFAQAPAPLRGKSITVTWTETRSQRDAGQTAFRPVSLPFDFTVYVSSEGRAFKRLTSTSASGRRTGTNEGVGAGRATADRVTAIEIRGNSIVHNVSSGGLGRRIQVTIDSSFSGCSAQVVTGKQSGAKVVATRSVATGGTVEFESVSAGPATCSIRAGNAFASVAPHPLVFA